MPKKHTLKQIVNRLEKELYDELGEEDTAYQEGYSDGIRTLAKIIKKVYKIR